MLSGSLPLESVHGGVHSPSSHRFGGLILMRFSTFINRTLAHQKYCSVFKRTSRALYLSIWMTSSRIFPKRTVQTYLWEDGWTWGLGFGDGCPIAQEASNHKKTDKQALKFFCSSLTFSKLHWKLMKRLCSHFQPHSLLQGLGSQAQWDKAQRGSARSCHSDSTRASLCFCWIGTGLANIIWCDAFLCDLVN